jgi:hypothetical protein
MTYINDHRDRRRYGRREDEPCGAWRRLPESLGRRAVCNRPYHPGDDFHLTADRQWWWYTIDTEPNPAGLFIPTDDRDAAELAGPGR